MNARKRAGMWLEIVLNVFACPRVGPFSVDFGVRFGIDFGPF